MTLSGRYYAWIVTSAGAREAGLRRAGFGEGLRASTVEEGHHPLYEQNITDEFVLPTCEQ